MDRGQGSGRKLESDGVGEAVGQTQTESGRDKRERKETREIDGGVRC